MCGRLWLSLCERAPRDRSQSRCTCGASGVSSTPVERLEAASTWYRRVPRLASPERAPVGCLARTGGRGRHGRHTQKECRRVCMSMGSFYRPTPRGASRKHRRSRRMRPSSSRRTVPVRSTNFSVYVSCGIFWLVGTLCVSIQLTLILVAKLSPSSDATAAPVGVSCGRYRYRSVAEAICSRALF